MFRCKNKTQTFVSFTKQTEFVNTFIAVAKVDGSLAIKTKENDDFDSGL